MQTIIICLLVSCIGSAVAHLSGSIGVAYVVGGLAVATIIAIIEASQEKK